MVIPAVPFTPATRIADIRPTDLILWPGRRLEEKLLREGEVLVYFLLRNWVILKKEET